MTARREKVLRRREPHPVSTLGAAATRAKATHQEAASDGITRRVLRDARPRCTRGAASSGVRRARHPTPPTAARGVLACISNSRPQSARGMPIDHRTARVTRAQGEHAGASRTRRELASRAGRWAAKRSSPGCTGAASRQAQRDATRRLKPRWLTEVKRERESVSCAAAQKPRTPAYAEWASMLGFETRCRRAEDCSSRSAPAPLPAAAAGSARARSYTRMYYSSI